jgi:hypothetical protein
VSDIRSLIDRVVEPVAPSPEAFERLVRRRALRHRNRRVGTALLAVVVAAAGISAAVLAFEHTTKPPVPVTHSEVAHAPLWPQYTVDKIRDVQARVDAGDQQFAWLVDPTKVARRFAGQVLGWKDVVVSSGSTGTSSSPVRRLDLATCAVGQSCGSNYRLPGSTVLLEQLGRTGTGGIWNVTGVFDRTIALWGPDGHPLAAGASLVADDPVAVTASGVEDGKVEVGSLNLACSWLVAYQETPLEDGIAYFNAGGTAGCPQGPLQSAPGFVLSFTPTGAELLHAGPQPDHIRLTAVPVQFFASTRPKPVPSPTQYLLELPSVPGRLDQQGGTILDVRTNLPEGTIASVYLGSADLETPLCCLSVHDGLIKLRVANNACHEVDGKLVGTKLTVIVQVHPVILTGAHCPMMAGATCGIQPQAPQAIASLGGHFEYVRGPQLKTAGALRLHLEASNAYQLPADTCTAKFVGNRQVPISP